MNMGRDAGTAFAMTVIMDIWHWTPLVTLTLLAALLSLPKEPFEQAQIDGASRCQIFWHITLPMIRPAILATVFIRLMDALRTVDEVWMLTGGGPGAATRYLGLYIWKVVFPKTDYGYGAAVSVIVALPHARHVLDALRRPRRARATRGTEMRAAEPLAEHPALAGRSPSRRSSRSTGCS